LVFGMARWVMGWEWALYAVVDEVYVKPKHGPLTTMHLTTPLLGGRRNDRRDSGEDALEGDSIHGLAKIIKLVDWSASQREAGDRNWARSFWADVQAQVDNGEVDDIVVSVLMEHGLNLEADGGAESSRDPDLIALRKRLEEIAAEFQLKTSKVIERLEHLEKGGQISGIFDDRGKFVYIERKEMEGVADWLNKKGRIGRADLVAACNRIIRLNPTEEDKKKLAAVKEKIKQSETLLHRMAFQHEVLQQQLTTVSSEREDLYTKFQHAIYDVQQKSGLKNLILEKKIDAVEEALETSEAQVSELLASANVDKATSAGISQKLDQVIAYKNDIVAQLQEEVARIKESHRTMVKTYESKLAEYGIPPEELGFRPNID